MREYSFLMCRKSAAAGGERLIIGEPTSFQFTRRLGRILSRLRKAYSETFPGAPELRLGIVPEPHNGASGRWSQADLPFFGPTFVVEFEPSLADNEALFAHEFVHPMIRCLGVPTGQSIGPIDERIGDEFTSTAHHPFVFDVLDEAGYGDDQRMQYRESARTEVAKLARADLTAITYTEPPGQTWLALWYFNFYLLAREEYESLYATHARSSRGVADRMDEVVASWMVATKSKGALKPNAQLQQTRVFQSEVFRRLDLQGRVSLESPEARNQFLFGAA
jgi:hypothetical protein